MQEQEVALGDSRSSPCNLRDTYWVTWACRIDGCLSVQHYGISPKPDLRAAVQLFPCKTAEYQPWSEDFPDAPFQECRFR